MALTRPRFYQSDTAVARIQDPITVLNTISTVANVDVGFIINRNLGTKSNVALYWNETGTEITLGFTANTGVNDGNIAVTGYANLRAGTIYGNIGGGSNQANVYITGSLIPSANVSYDLGTDGRRFKDLWLSGTTLHMGDQRLTVTNSQWQFTTPGSNVILGSQSTVANLTVTGTLTLQGPTTTFDSNNLVLQDSIIELHTQANLAPLTGDDCRDIGLTFHYYKTQDEHAFLGFKNSTGFLEWYDSGSEGVGNVFTGNTFGTIKSGGLILSNTTSSISTTTGALTVAGGAGIAGNVYVGTNLLVGSINVASNLTTVATNINTLFSSVTTQDANIGAYQTYANANVVAIQANVGAYQTYANANVVAIQANVGAYQTYANTRIQSIDSNLGTTTTNITTLSGNAATQQTQIDNLVSGANANSFAYLTTTGATVAAATTAFKTQVDSNINAGTAYVSFVNATSGNVSQNVNTGLTYNPSTGNLTAYGLITTTGLFWANGTAFTSGGSTYSNVNVEAYIGGNIGAYQTWANNNFGTSTYSNTNVEAYIGGNIGAYQTYANTTVAQIQANLGAYQTYANADSYFTASTTQPITPEPGDQWYNTTTDILYEFIANYWVDIQSPSVTSNGVSSYGNTQVASYLSTYSGAIGVSLNVGANVTVTGNILPSANITYDLGSNTQRWRDLYLSGSTINLGGATIKTDVVTGAIALIPQPTAANPNPKGIVVSPAGTVSAVSTTGGSLTATAISDSSNTATTTNTTTFGNLTSNGNIITANVYADRFFYSNGTAFSSSNYGNTEVAAYLVANPQGSTYGNTNVEAYLGANLGSATTNITTLFSNAATQATSINTINSNVTAANSAIQTLSANIGTLVAGAPGALDTLYELGNALGNSASFSSTMVNWLGNITSNVTAANASISTFNANIGAFQTYANLHFSDTSFGNSNVASYLMSNVSGVAATTGAINVPVGTTAERPATTSNGAIRYNTTLGRIEGYMYSGGWQNILSDSYSVEYLIIAGGAGGGSSHPGSSGGGGGGAGGFLTGTGVVVTPNGTYAVAVGAGGDGGVAAAHPQGTGGNGTNSSALSYTAIGGGGGGGNGPTSQGQVGGSGGGGGGQAATNILGGAGTPGQGYSGGQTNTSNAPNYGSGGGGGAGAAGGGASNTTGGNGGAGLESSYSGTATYYAGGGGGSTYNGGTAGTGGSGGGGNGGTGGGSTAGTTNRGGGGGGGSQGGAGSAGGSGIVIIRYLGSQRGTGGTVTTSGGYTIHTFTGSGTFTA